MKLGLVTTLLSLSVCLATAPVCASTQPFDVHDLVAMQRISDPQPSPDGSRVVFVVTNLTIDILYAYIDPRIRLQ